MTRGHSEAFLEPLPQCCQVGEKFVAQILIESSPKVAQNFLNWKKEPKKVAQGILTAKNRKEDQELQEKMVKRVQKNLIIIKAKK